MRLGGSADLLGPFLAKPKFIAAGSVGVGREGRRLRTGGLFLFRFRPVIAWLMLAGCNWSSRSWPSPSRP
jgi:hypothetical protein